MQFGMPTLIENRTLAENIALCRELGLNFLELNMNFPEYQLDRLKGTDALLRAADEAGIYYTIHLDEGLNIADFNPLVSAAYRETVRQTIETAKGLLCLRNRYGDPAQPLVLNMHMHHGIHITLPDRKVQMYARDLDSYLEAFHSFRGLCEEWIGDADLVIAIENTDGFQDYERKAVEYLLQSPCFGLTWDIGHDIAAGERDIPFLMAHSSRLIHFHIHDGTARPPRNHLALGDGQIDLREKLRYAESRGARCVLETKTIAALKQSVAWLNHSHAVTGPMMP